MSSSRGWYFLAALLLVVACVHHPPAVNSSHKPRPSPAKTPIAEGDEGTSEDEGTSYADEGTTDDEGTSYVDEDEDADEDEPDEAPDEPEENVAIAPDHPEAPTVLPGNIVFQVLRPGSGRRPLAHESVRVRYVGRLADGRVFDDSKNHGGEMSFPLRAVIPCWTTGLMHMNAGSKVRLTCPPATAYGERGAPPTVPPNATLEFDIELISIQPGR